VKIHDNSWQKNECMMANYNKVLLLGNLTRDPQLSYTPNQTPVVDFGLAVNRRWTGQDGSQREETCFIDCRAFGRSAENINKYCAKGRPLLVEGRLTYDTWTGQDGSKRSKHRVTVQSFQFIGSNRTDQMRAEPNNTTSGRPDQSSEQKDDIPF